MTLEQENERMTASSEKQTKPIKVSKLDAARRQLVTAIRLYFNHGDIVSMHTLAAAASKITQNISDSSANLPDSMTNWVAQLVKPAYHKAFWNKLHETTNFLKHAETDPDTVHEFYPQQTENRLFLGVYQYQLLTDECSPEIRLFSTWYVMQHPEILDTPPEVPKRGKDLFQGDRSEFWRLLFPLLQGEVGSTSL